ncbi:MAG: AAA family ATPase, partial [Phycisphaerae bacterium]|nr:AAA family ATPase [Phycisphaerae bacterium]
AIAYLVISASRSQHPPGPPLIIVEEPENGIYVGQLKPLLQRIDPNGAGGQFIFTSQSPYFIDLFDSHLEGLHVFKPGKPSAVLVKPDVEKTRRLLEQMPLGEMHFREMLG